MPLALAVQTTITSQPVPIQPAGTYNASQQNQRAPQPPKPASYSIGLVGGPSTSTSQALVLGNNRVYEPSPPSAKPQASANVVIAGRDPRPTVEEITDSEEEHLINGESHSVTVSSGSTSKPTPSTYHLRAAAGEARKRRRVGQHVEEDEEELVYEAIEAAPSPPAKPKKRATCKRGEKKTLKPITGMISKPEVDIADILMTQKVTLPAMHLYQISPFFRDECKRLVISSRKPRKKQSQAANEDSGATVASVASVALRTEKRSGDKTIKWAAGEYHNMLHTSYAAFNIPATLSKHLNKGKQVDLPFGCAKAGQGSDLVIINEKLAEDLRLKFRSSRELDHEGVKITVASGDNHRLDNWVVLHVDVDGIRRKIWAFVTPPGSPAVHTQLLLGVPLAEVGGSEN